jgi:MFS family permease
MATLVHTSVARGHGPSIGRSILPLLILALAIAVGFTAMGSFAMMAESAKAELGLSDATLGLVQGVGAAVPLVLFSVPIGILVDRFNRARLFLLLALVWSGGTLLTALAPNAWILFVARMLTGIGTTGALTCALSLSADLCLPEQRGRAMLINALGKSFGQAGAFAVAGWLLGMFAAAQAPVWFGAISAWRSTQVVLAIASVIFVLPLLLLREPPRHEVEAGPQAPFRVVAGELWRRRAFLIPLFIGQASVVMADAAAGIWAAPILQRDYALQPAQFAGWFGALLLGTGIFGSMLGGLVADWGQKSGRRGGILIGALVAAIVGVPMALFPVMPTTLGFASLLGVLVLCGTITGLVTSVALTVLLPNELRGLAIGAFIAFAGLIGFGIAPSLVTAVSALLGGESHLAAALAIVGIAVSLVSVWGFAAAMRHVPAKL